MRHKNTGRKFDRNSSSRRAMFRNMAANLILHERIETTDAKAKELRGVTERLITKAKHLGEVAYTPQDKLSEHDRGRRLAIERQLSAYLSRFGTRVEKGGEVKRVDIVEKVLVDLAKRFASRPGGYTRIIKFGPRRGDNAPMSVIEFVGSDAPAAGAEGEATEKKKKKKKAAAAA